MSVHHVQNGSLNIPVNLEDLCLQPIVLLTPPSENEAGKSFSVPQRSTVGAELRRHRCSDTSESQSHKLALISQPLEARRAQVSTRHLCAAETLSLLAVGVGTWLRTESQVDLWKGSGSRSLGSG